MNQASFFPWILVILAVLLAAGAIWAEHRQTRRVLRSVSRMIDRAAQGDFEENGFDESLLSSVEAKMVDYLSASTLSNRNFRAEKEKIKELIGDISHQTKTPIANLLLYSELLAERELPEDCRDCVLALNSQAEKLSFLIDSLVKLSRLETGILTLHPKNTELVPLLKGVLAQILPKAETKAVVLRMGASVSEGGAEGFCALCDPKWTAEAIYNLVDNGVKYTPPGGSVSIEVMRYELFCRIDVADTGPGISEGEQAKIFGRFYRSPEISETEGVGIGLHLTRQIVASQGGYVKVSSKPGRGAVFSVFLPREEEIFQNR